MANDTATTLEQDVKQASVKQAAPKVKVPAFEIEPEQAVAILNADTLTLIGKMFTAQDEYENEAKYSRKFLHLATVAFARQTCRTMIEAWKREIHKVSDLHPTWSQEQCESELLQSRKKQAQKAMVDVAVSLLKSEFK